ncbi:uncharacterized protein LOC121047903 [Ixodes scapularis]|uniref:uncharacterized protein LOC121047903 n=1 Tax=Ixodes scapularis TaxID=6945 RepID=UPI001C381E2B|nr:uncharacterized protein LOC121047903 [Ixodes scapularis]
MAMVEKLIEEKITDAQLAAIVKSKLPEVQVCLMTMAAMTPEITVKVVELMLPAMNDCGVKIAAAERSQWKGMFDDCSREATATVKVSTGMGDDDAKLFDEGMDCLRAALTF